MTGDGELVFHVHVPLFSLLFSTEGGSSCDYVIANGYSYVSSVRIVPNDINRWNIIDIFDYPSLKWERNSKLHSLLNENDLRMNSNTTSAKTRLTNNRR